MSEKSKEDRVFKYVIITLGVIIPLFALFVWYNTRDTPEEQQAVEAQYENYDSTVWIPQKVKYKTTEKYEKFTLYKLSFYDGSEITVTVGDYNDLKEGDSTCYGETKTFRRRIN